MLVLRLVHSPSDFVMMLLLLIQKVITTVSKLLPIVKGK